MTRKGFSDICVNCKLNASVGNNRCNPCRLYLSRKGHERPEELWKRKFNNSNMSLIDRLLNPDYKTININGCWLWNGKLSDKGYGIIRDRKRQTRVHIISFQHFKGTIPEGLELDHTCRVRNCFNPEHLEPVTHQENLNRKIYHANQYGVFPK